MTGRIAGKRLRSVYGCQVIQNLASDFELLPALAITRRHCYTDAMETRHPHPHKDPRAPRDGDTCVINPPVFVWKPDTPNPPYELVVSKSRDMSHPVIRVEGVEDPIYLPEKQLDPGTYYWRWRGSNGEAPVFSFSISADALEFEVPPAKRWLDSMPDTHPRLYFDEEVSDTLKQVCEAGKHPLFNLLIEDADRILEQEQEMPEPEYLPDRSIEYEKFSEAFKRIMWGSREFAAGASTLALAWRMTGDDRYGRAATARYRSMCSWDPDGSSYIGHNDEAHMSIIWYGLEGIDWLWSFFDEDDKQIVLGHLRHRARNTYEHMHDKGTYGIDRFDSHAGREIVFLAWTLMAFHEHIPEAEQMLDWLRPVLCGVWPVWAKHDGSWAEGVGYSTPYVAIMARFAFILKHTVGIDLFRKPFWRNYAEWRRWFVPPYAQGWGFGDNSFPHRQSLLRGADVLALIRYETSDNDRAAGSSTLAGGNSGDIPDPADADLDRYIDELRAAGYRAPERKGVFGYSFTPMRFVIEGRLAASEAGAGEGSSAPHTRDGAGTAASATGTGVVKVFSDTGQAAIRTDFADPETDTAFLFRSSPYGSISHSHANNNDFVLHAGGKVLAMPSGYYTGYASPHHANWVWHTKSHNCVTLSGATQILRSHDSVGSVNAGYEDENIAYFRGNAAASYSHMAEVYTRHVWFIKSINAFLLIDDFVCAAGVISTFEWNIHSFYRFLWNDGDREFRLTTSATSPETDVRLIGRFLYQKASACAISEGWEPKPLPTKSYPTYPMQYNLRFSSGIPVESIRLGVFLIPVFAGDEEPDISTELENDVELGAIGDKFRAEIGESTRVYVSGTEYMLTENGPLQA